MAHCVEDNSYPGALSAAGISMDVCNIRISTADKIRLPPQICTVDNLSPRKRYANSEAATVSELEAIDAPVGLTRRSPNKKMEKGTSVEQNANNSTMAQR